MIEQAYFLTVDWCNKGRRGVFANTIGTGFRKDEPHTKEEMREILGPFWMVLSPESTLFTVDELAKHNRFVPLEEYSNEYGVVLKAEQLQEETNDQS